MLLHLPYVTTLNSLFTYLLLSQWQQLCKSTIQHCTAPPFNTYAGPASAMSNYNPFPLPKNVVAFGHISQFVFGLTSDLRLAWGCAPRVQQVDSIYFSLLNFVTFALYLLLRMYYSLCTVPLVLTTYSLLLILIHIPLFAQQVHLFFVLTPSLSTSLTLVQFTISDPRSVSYIILTLTNPNLFPFLLPFPASPTNCTTTPNTILISRSRLTRNVNHQHGLENELFQNHHAKKHAPS